MHHIAIKTVLNSRS